MGSQFRRKHNQSLARFDVLSQLYRLDDNWTAIGELAGLLMASGGNITGLMDRMIKENLLIRRPSPDDRRSYQIKMTAEGRKLFQKMNRDHERWISELLTDIPNTDQDNLIDLLVRVRHAFDPATDKI